MAPMARIRTLPERHGRVVLILLGIALAVGSRAPADRGLRPDRLLLPGGRRRALRADRRAAVHRPPVRGPRVRQPVRLVARRAAVLRRPVLRHRRRARGARAAVDRPARPRHRRDLLPARPPPGRPRGRGRGGDCSPPPTRRSSSTPGRLLSEPLAEVAVPGAVLAFLWAYDRRSPWAWLAPGALIGLSALARPEYLLFGVVLAVLALIRSGIPAAALLTVASRSWSRRGRCTSPARSGASCRSPRGAARRCSSAPYLPGDGIHDRVKIDLMERYLGMRNVTPEQRARQPMEPLLDRVAARYPDMPRDEALGRIGRANLARYAREQPVALARMTLTKMRWMWRGSSGAMLSPAAVVLQTLIVLFAVAGLVMLAWQRRFEAVLLGALVLGVTRVLRDRARGAAPQPRADAAGDDAGGDRARARGAAGARARPGSARPAPAGAGAGAMTAVAPQPSRLRRARGPPRRPRRADRARRDRARRARAARAVRARAARRAARQRLGRVRLGRRAALRAPALRAPGRREPVRLVARRSAVLRRRLLRDRRRAPGDRAARGGAAGRAHDRARVPDRPPPRRAARRADRARCCWPSIP